MELDEKLDSGAILEGQMGRGQHAFESIKNHHLGGMGGRA